MISRLWIFDISRYQKWTKKRDETYFQYLKIKPISFKTYIFLGWSGGFSMGSQASFGLASKAAPWRPFSGNSWPKDAATEWNEAMWTLYCVSVMTTSVRHFSTSNSIFIANKKWETLFRVAVILTLLQEKKTEVSRFRQFFVQILSLLESHFGVCISFWFVYSITKFKSSFYSFHLLLRQSTHLYYKQWKDIVFVHQIIFSGRISWKTPNKEYFRPQMYDYYESLKSKAIYV